MDVFPAFRAECGRVGKIYGFCKAHFRRICSLLTPKAELVWAKPLHLANARPLCRLKAPLGLSLLRKREPEKCQRFRRAGCCGLWHPVSASTLGRVSHPAGHCPNNSSLFLPQAAVVVVAKKGLLAPFNPKAVVKTQKTNAAPVGAIVLTFFAFLRFKVAARRP